MIGDGAAWNLQGDYNAIIGSYAGDDLKGNNNSAYGYRSGYSAQGDNNNYTGYYSGLNSSGNNNSFDGHYSGISNTGNNNTATGFKTGVYTTGSGNSAVGVNAGNFIQGEGNVAIGRMAGSRIGLNDSATGAIDRAGNAATSISRLAVSNTVSLGNYSYTTKSEGVALGSQANASTDAGVVGYLGGANTSAVWKSTLAAVSVGGVDANGNLNTRQITNVAAGTQLTDAVNVAQLQATQIHYYSVNDNGVVGALNFDNQGAVGVDSMVLGVGSRSNSTNVVAIGKDIILGKSAANSVVIGNSANTNTTGNVAIGYSANAQGVGSVVVGSLSNTNAQSAVIGHMSLLIRQLNIEMFMQHTSPSDL